MLEVSSNHFNNTHNSEGPNTYLRESEESFGFSRSRGVHKPIGDLTVGSYSESKCCGTRNDSLDVRSSPGCIENPRLSRRFRDMNSIPLLVSTPSDEGVKSHQEAPFTHLQRKARRISRMYLDGTTNPFEDLVVEPPLLEYLVRHGALSSEASEIILRAEEHEQRGLLLSELGLSQSSEVSIHLNGALPLPSTTGFALLLNALRHTGHHSLASHLDCGRRIRPSPGLHTNEDAELGISSLIHRRRGQLSLQIRLDAIKVDPAVYENLLCPLTSSKDPADLGCEHGSTPLTKSKPVAPMLPSFVESLATNSPPLNRKSSTAMWSCSQTSFWIDQGESVQIDTELRSEPQPAANVELPVNGTSPEKSIGCFHKLFCLFYPLRKHKTRKRSRPAGARVTESHTTPNPSHAVDVTDMSLTRFRRPLVPMDGAGDGPTVVPQDDRLAKTKLALLDTKCSEFCQIVLDASLPFHDAVVKYFEQSSGVLVLDCTANPPTCTETERPNTPVNRATSLCVTVVATRPDLVTRLVDVCQQCRNPSLEIPRSDPSCGSRLSIDLQKVLNEADIRSVLYIQDFRLSVTLDESEVNKALEELADLVE